MGKVCYWPSVIGNLHNLSPFLASLTAAGLLWLSYFPVAWGWLGWVALVPLLYLVRTPARTRTVYLGAWAAGLAFFWPVLQWLRVADPRMYYTWAALATYCSLYFPAAVFLLRRLDQRTRLPLVVTLPAVWTSLEFARSYLLTGFSWYYLGHTQHGFLPLIQVSDLGGAYAVTFVVAAVNAAVFELLYRWRGLRTFFGLPDPAACPSCCCLTTQVLGVLLLVTASGAYGMWRLGQDDFAPGPRVALIQGNLDQRIRNARHGTDAEAAHQAAASMVDHYCELSDRAALDRPDLIVWPETSYPGYWTEVDPQLPAGKVPEHWQRFQAETRELTHRVARHWQTATLIGLNAEVLDADERSRRYNSAVLIQPDATVGGRYDKIHRVPFGEYVPFRDWFPWMSRFAPYEFDYSIRPGESLTRFPLGDYRFGVIICYEDTDPELARQYVRPGGSPPVDFLLNISNDGWFNGTSEHDEHLAICRFRAVECRRAVARAVNMGISAVIDGNGRVTALPGPTWADSKKVEGVVTAALPIDRRQSWYAWWGDSFAWGCCLFVAVGLVSGLRSRAVP